MDDDNKIGITLEFEDGTPKMFLIASDRLDRLRECAAAINRYRRAESFDQRRIARERMFHAFDRLQPGDTDPAP